MSRGKPVSAAYTCADYRAEMILLQLNRRLNDPSLSPGDREAVERQIKSLEIEMGLD